MWTGKVVEPIFGKGGEIVPDGSTVDGHIFFANGSGKAKAKDKEKGEMMLVADSISTPDSTKYNIVGNAGAAQGAQATGQGMGSRKRRGAHLFQERQEHPNSLRN